MDGLPALVRCGRTVTPCSHGFQMNRIGVDEARICLERAKAKLLTMKETRSIGKLEQLWSEFLLMANRVHVKLEQGAKFDSTSKAWYGLKKHDRRTDPLLSYLKNARDADEHGLRRITARTELGGGFILTPNVPWSGHIEKHDWGWAMFVESEHPEASARPVIVPPNVKLVEVFNYGNRYPPPATHMGQPVPRYLNLFPHPIPVGRLAIRYLEGLIAEAQSLVP
jgi:hypothetical protein